MWCAVRTEHQRRQHAWTLPLATNNPRIEEYTMSFIGRANWLILLATLATAGVACSEDPLDEEGPGGGQGTAEGDEPLGVSADAVVSDPLLAYSKKCDLEIGASVPQFRCEDDVDFVGDSV